MGLVTTEVANQAIARLMEFPPSVSRENREYPKIANDIVFKIRGYQRANHHCAAAASAMTSPRAVLANTIFSRASAKASIRLTRAAQAAEYVPDFLELRWRGAIPPKLAFYRGIRGKCTGHRN